MARPDEMDAGWTSADFGTNGQDLGVSGFGACV